VLIVSAPRRNGSGEANTLIRGVTPRGMELRPQVETDLMAAGSRPASARWPLVERMAERSARMP